MKPIAKECLQLTGQCQRASRQRKWWASKAERLTRLASKPKGRKRMSVPELGLEAKVENLE